MAEESTAVNLPQINTESAQRITEMDEHTRIMKIKGMELAKKKSEQRKERNISVKNTKSVGSSKPSITAEPKEQAKYNLDQEKERANLVLNSIRRIKVDPIEEQIRKDQEREEIERAANQQFYLLFTLSSVAVGAYVIYRLKYAA